MDLWGILLHFDIPHIDNLLRRLIYSQGEGMVLLLSISSLIPFPIFFFLLLLFWRLSYHRYFGIGRGDSNLHWFRPLELILFLFFGRRLNLVLHWFIPLKLIVIVFRIAGLRVNCRLVWAIFIEKIAVLVCVAGGSVRVLVLRG